MFGISLPELLLVLLVVLLLFGPERLPDIAKSIGKLAGTLKKSTDSVRQDFYDVVNLDSAHSHNQLTDSEKTIQDEQIND